MPLRPTRDRRRGCIRRAGTPSTLGLAAPTRAASSRSSSSALSGRRAAPSRVSAGPDTDHGADDPRASADIGNPGPSSAGGGQDGTMPQLPTLTLNDGTWFPELGLGTYNLRGEEGIASAVAAIESGYRLLDTAVNYENEREM